MLKWATEEVDNPDLRDRGFIYWRLLSTDPGAAADIVFSEKPPISTESEAMDRGMLDRLLLHTGTLASLYGKEAHTFVRGAQPKFLQDSPALDPEAKQSYLDSLNLPPPSTALAGAASPPPPAVPPKPFGQREDSYDGRQDSALSAGGGDYGLGVRAGGLIATAEEEDEDEGEALNPTALTASTTGGREQATPSPAPQEHVADDALDPYASLARMSMDFGGGGQSSGGGYGYDAAQPVKGRNFDESLL